MENKLPDIDGWFYPLDIEFYRETFEELPDNAKTLEVGCWKGRSICSVADIIKRKNITAYVIDTFLGSEDERETFHKEAKTVDIEKIFRENIEAFGIAENVVVLRADSRKVWETVEIPDKFFDFVFIDGQHSTDAVEADINHSLPKLKDDGLLAGHDCVFPFVVEGVRRAIGDDFELDVNIWKRKRGEPEVRVKNNDDAKIILISAWSKPMRTGAWPAKNPSKTWWTKTVKLLKDKGYAVWQIGQGPEIKLKFVDRHIFDKDLWDLGHDIMSCTAWVSVDNFFHHWALLQFKKPGVVIWSQSDPEIFGHKENFNLLKDRKYLREKQFQTWEQATYDREAFVEPEEVVAAVEETINKTGETKHD